MVSPSSESAVATALRLLANATQRQRMYPASSRMVGQSLEDAHRALVDALPAAGLELRVDPDSLRWQEGGHEASAALPGLAWPLHELLVGSLEISPELTLESLGQMVSEINSGRDSQKGESRESILFGGELKGLRARRFSVDHLFEPAMSGDASAAGAVWCEILEAYSTEHHRPISWREATAETRNVVQVLRWIGDSGRHPSSLSNLSQVDLATLALERLASESQVGAARTIQNLSEAVRATFADIDPEVWIELMSDSLPVDLQELPGAEPGQETAVDIAALAAQSLTQAQAERLLSYGLETRSRATPRMYRLFDSVLAGRPDQDQVATRLRARLERSSPDENVATAWPDLESLLLRENVDAYTTVEYRSLLESAAAPATPVSLPKRLRQRRLELEPDTTCAAAARVVLSLLARERDDDTYLAMLKRLDRGAGAALRTGEFDLFEAIVATLARHSGDPGRSHSQRAGASALICAMEAGETTQQLLALVATRPAEHFHVLWKALEHFDNDWAPELLDAFAESACADRARLSRLLERPSTIAVAELVERVQGSNPRFVRELVLALGDIGRLAHLPVIEQAGRHDDAGVRTAAVAALRCLPPEHAEPGLLQALADRSWQVRVAALQAFKERSSDDTLERLRSTLNEPNLTGRNSARIVAAIRALEWLADDSVLPALRPLCRAPWLFRARRLPVRDAALRAVDTLSKARDQGFGESDGETLVAVSSRATAAAVLRRAA